MLVMVRRLMVVLVATLAVLVYVGNSAAQTFRFRLAPLCNKVTLSLVESTSQSVIGVVGYDDFCGDALTRLPVYGTAVLNFDGSVSIGFTTSAPSSLVGSDVAIQTNVVWPANSPYGFWSDDDGNSGTFQFDVLDQPSG